jgi:hypothetical protein
MIEKNIKITLLASLLLYTSSFGLTQSYIGTTPLMSFSFGYYQPKSLQLTSMGQLGLSAKLIFWDSIDIEYTYIMHSDLLMETELRNNTYYTHDLWLGYQFKIGDMYRLEPQIGSYWRYITKENNIQGFKFGIRNIIFIADESIQIYPFIGYHDNETIYGIDICGFGGNSVVLKGIISYEYSETFQLFTFNVQVGLPLHFLD